MEDGAELSLGEKHFDGGEGRSVMSPVWRFDVCVRIKQLALYSLFRG